LNPSPLHGESLSGSPIAPWTHTAPKTSTPLKTLPVKVSMKRVLAKQSKAGLFIANNSTNGAVKWVSPAHQKISLLSSRSLDTYTDINVLQTMRAEGTMSAGGDNDSFVDFHAQKSTKLSLSPVALTVPAMVISV